MNSLLLISSLLALVSVGSAVECTRGRLFVSDADSNVVHTFNLDPSTTSNTPIHTGPTVTLPEGSVAARLYASSTDNVVSAYYMGNATDFWSDGRVSFIHSGVSVDSSHVVSSEITMEAPTLDDFSVQCARPIHHVAHRRRIAIFCDGAYDAVPQVNSSAYFVDERLLKSGADPVVYHHQLEGQQHGVAIPLDETHFLVSIAPEERINRQAASSLPAGFHIFNDQGDLVHGVNDQDEAHMSCVGFHGSGHIGDNYAFGCGSGHDNGVLLIQYGPSLSFSSSKILHAAGRDENLRVGSFVDHHHAPAFVGNYGSSSVVAVEPTHRGSMQEAHILDLPAARCGFGYEKTTGKYLYVWLANGVLQVYKVWPEWILVASVTVSPDMEACTGTNFIGGHGFAYITDSVAKAIHTVDLRSLSDITVSTTPLSFTPAFMTVAGVPEDTECTGASIKDSYDHNRAHTSVWMHLRNTAGADIPPGSDALTDLTYGLRKDVAAQLDLPIARVHLAGMHINAKDKVYVRMAIMDAVSTDTNAARSADLAESLASTVKQGSHTGETLSSIDEAYGVQMQSEDEDTVTPPGVSSTGGDDDDEGLSTLAIVGITVLACAFVVSVFVAVRAKQNENAVIAKYTRHTSDVNMGAQGV